MPDDPVYQATALSSAYDRIERLPVVVMLDHVRSLYNVGSFFRTCDAVRVTKLLLNGITATPPNSQIAKTALGADQSVAWEKPEDPLAALETLRGQGWQLAAIETSLHAVDLFDWQPAFPVCVVFGHEVDGIRPELLTRCDTHVRIPTLGLKQSLNVATAGGVVLYELLRKYRLRIPRGPLAPARRRRRWTCPRLGGMGAPSGRAVWPDTMVQMSAYKLDERGVVAPCPNCGQQNRILFDRLAGTVRCPKCKTDIHAPSAPVDVPSTAAFDAVTQQSAIPVVVDYWASWCGPCRMVAPELEKIAQQHQGDFLVVKVDTEALQELAIRFHIQSIPMLAVFYRGHEKARMVGARPAREILAFIQQAIDVQP